jgi:hypothetical protein
MKIFSSLSKGWSLGMASLKIINKNKKLMLFPVISGMSLLLVTVAIVGGGFLFFDEHSFDAFLSDDNSSNIALYVASFLFYLINYFIVIFFNVGLVFCAKKAINNEPTSFSEGVSFAATRISTIFSWAILAATVGVILNAIQEKAGGIGKIITSVIGVVWNIATFFVVPIIAYEDVNAIQALKKSALMMKEKFGESIGANFSFGLFSIIGFLISAIIAVPLWFIHPFLGIGAGVLLIGFAQIFVSTGQMVFISAVYQKTNGKDIALEFNEDVLDDIFIKK